MLTLAAAAVVVLLPTACDYAVADTGGSGGGYGLPSGHGGHGTHGGPTSSEVETVPAGETQTLDPGSSATETSTTGTDPTGTGTSETDPPETSTEETSTEETDPPPPAAPEILGNDCTNSGLDAHTGFQDAPRCVAVAFGEVAAAALSPSLLITEAPDSVGSGEAFTLTVSTRNLLRDRFLGAAAGGYYRESSFLTPEGIQRGHFHTACRVLPDVTEAPDAEPVPEFFLATQDNKGGAGVDEVVVPVTGIEGSGTLQCAVWAGDGSHRVPMMQRANQTPAFDIVRIQLG
ncbi:hypothetical protein [Pseudonocardia sp.]|uniref:hypothetical protein n=1 Tax=Pseudonocardia sp. TaxID=60912 RepID=UPI00260FEBBA|nr:hypothetical protein [Pseudonocardia sp.]